MQKLAVVYFPTINLEKVNSLRRKHDPNFHIIPPHITIVSPFYGISGNQLISHFKNILKDAYSFSVHLTDLAKTEDGLLFLPVKEGREQLINLHDRLYSGILASYIPTDFPFVPHITLGNFGAEKSTLYRDAEKANFDITCVLNEMSIIKGDEISPAKIVKTIKLHN